MTTQEVADTLVKLCSEGKFDEAVATLYSPDIVSMEAGAPPGQSRETKGLPAVKAKGEWWTANHEVHSAKVEGPLVAPRTSPSPSSWTLRLSLNPNASPWKRWPFTKSPTAKLCTKSSSITCRQSCCGPARLFPTASLQNAE